MRRFASDYLAFFRLPDVATIMTVALLARMPIGMVGLAMLLTVREALGSYAVAGSISGIYFVSMAVGAPIQGRLIDRLGPKPILAVTGAVHPIALVAVLAAAQSQAVSALSVAAAFAGCFAMPITVLTRTLWRHRFTDESDRRRAFSVDSVLVEVNFTLGPALVAGIVSTVNARAAFGLAIFATLAALFLFLSSPALRYFRPEPRAERHWLGPLTDGRLILVYTAVFGLTSSFGFLEVGYPGYATAIGMTALGGVYLSLCSFGSAVGGAIFGGISPRLAIERQFAVTTGLMVVPLLLHWAVSAPVLFGVIAVLAGAAIAPSLACQSVLVSRLAPDRYATEAFTWGSTFIVSGIGAGLAFGGWLVETQGPKSPFLVGAAVMATVSLGTLLVSGRSSRRPRP